MNSSYLFYPPKKAERLGPWRSHLLVLITGPYYWESNTQTTRLLLYLKLEIQVLKKFVSKLFNKPGFAITTTFTLIPLRLRKSLSVFYYYFLKQLNFIKLVPNDSTKHFKRTRNTNLNLFNYIFKYIMLMV